MAVPIANVKKLKSRQRSEGHATIQAANPASDVEVTALFIHIKELGPLIEGGGGTTYAFYYATVR